LKIGFDYTKNDTDIITAGCFHRKMLAPLSHLPVQESIDFSPWSNDLDVYIFGITGHRELVIPLEDLEVEDLDVGGQFVYNGLVYEIRSVAELDKGLIINVVQRII